ncbi:MAG: GIY-YIG nuclease family protein [Patescibacteria group bacterium]
MGFYIYVIYNDERDKIYIGQTADLEKRLRRHNGELKNKQSSFTSRNEGKWRLIYNEKVSSRKEAMARERQLKTSRGRLFIRSVLG